MIGSGASGSDKLSIVSGRLFTMFSASVNRVRRASSSNWWAWSCKTLERTARTVRISRSHMPPIWDAVGTFILNSIRSQSCVRRKFLIASVLTSFKAALSSFLPPTKFVPLSHLSSLTLPLRLTKRLRALRNESVSIVFNVSK